MFLLLLFFVKLICAQAEYIGVENEYDLANLILVSQPSSEIIFVPYNMEFGYSMNIIDPYKAIRQHEDMQRELEDLGTTVLNVRDVLLNGTHDEFGDDYNDLLEFASNFLKYDDSYLENEKQMLMNLENITVAQRSSLIDEIHKLEPRLSKSAQNAARLKALSNMPPESLVDIILNRPTIELHLKHWFMDDDLAFVIVRSKTLQNPLDTLHYIRDQQIITKTGIVMLTNPPDREGENLVTEFVFRKLGFNIIGKQTTGYAEGGDFIPMGNIAFFGQGLPTTYSAIEEIMTNDWFGFDEIVVVKLKLDRVIERVRLNSVFNVLDEGHVLVLETIINNPKELVYVDVYSKRDFGSNSEKRFGPYMKVANHVKFGDFLTSKNFKITTITRYEERYFGADFLNVGRGTIVTPFCKDEYLRKLEDVGIKVQCLNVDELLEHGGGVHCMTQVLTRISANYNFK